MRKELRGGNGRLKQRTTIQKIDRRIMYSRAGARMRDGNKPVSHFVENFGMGFEQDARFQRLASSALRRNVPEQPCHHRQCEHRFQRSSVQLDACAHDSFPVFVRSCINHSGDKSPSVRDICNGDHECIFSLLYRKMDRVPSHFLIDVAAI